MKFRKRPIVIEAEQWLGPDPETNLRLGIHSSDDGSNTWIMETLEGPFMVSSGDWIITGIKGEKYPCKADIFEATYERA